jgi:hypothetical protein
VLKYRRPVIKRKPTQVIVCPSASARGIGGRCAEVGFIAGLLIDKFAYYRPLYRQHQRLSGNGITVSRSRRRIARTDLPGAAVQFVLLIAFALAASGFIAWRAGVSESMLFYAFLAMLAISCVLSWRWTRIAKYLPRRWRWAEAASSNRIAPS